MYYTGGPAFSHFRLDKLLDTAKTLEPTLINLTAQYLYIVDIEGVLSETEETVLVQDGSVASRVLFQLSTVTPITTIKVTSSLNDLQYYG